MPNASHIPVLGDVAKRYLITNPSWTYVDGTLGGGGHADIVCRSLSGDGCLIGFDCDEEALHTAARTLEPFAEKVTLVHANFRAMSSELRNLGIASVGGVLLDLGVSSLQLDEPQRGFSFRSDANLDMRMDQRQSFRALDVVNGFAEQDLSDLLFRYGEERRAKRIARTIVARRPLATTRELRAAVEVSVGGRSLVKSLARVFQALRIEVNHELDNLSVALAEALPLLHPGGRMVVIAYHSLEDRIVKEFFRRHAATKTPSGHRLVPDTPREPALRILTVHPVIASSEEVRKNPRARSAKLRAAEKL
jgi:16S rRNA (cytosine1402-N4)-methyltransferase